MPFFNASTIPYLSIKFEFTIPIPKVKFSFKNWLKISSLLSWLNFFESLTNSGIFLLFKKDATTKGPAKAPLPASSIPIINFSPLNII